MSKQTFQVSPQFRQIQATERAAAAVSKLAEAVERLADHFCPVSEEAEDSSTPPKGKSPEKSKKQSKPRNSKASGSEKELQNASAS